MRLPSDAQAALLALEREYAASGRAIEWQTNATTGAVGRPSIAALHCEHVNRDRDTTSFLPVHPEQRVATVKACLREGWLAGLHERTVNWPATRWSEAHTWHLTQLDMTEDGTIALGLWRQRKLKAPPVMLPELTLHDREIVELAQRALELGYALCARRPARGEARRMRRAGWFTDCWVANSVSGLVPTPLALVEIRPEEADRPLELPS